MRTVIWVTTSFVGFHRWISAPIATAFLKNYHRHVFHVKMGIKVQHNDRDVEFFDMKAKLVEFLMLNYRDEKFDASCETIAEAIILHFGTELIEYVEVSEDGENGAVVYS